MQAGRNVPRFFARMFCQSRARPNPKGKVVLFFLLLYNYRGNKIKNMALFSSESKPASNWYVAATHYLTGGLVTPGIISGVVGYGLGAVGFNKSNSLVQLAVGLVINIFALWLGIMYSANYISRSYIIRDKAKVVKLSTIYYVLGSAVFIVITFVFNIILALAYSLSGKIGQIPTAYDYFVIVAISILETYLFFYFSKKYL